LDDEKATKVHKDSRKHDKAHHDHRARDLDDREPEHDFCSNVNIQCLPDKRKPSRKVEGVVGRSVLATSDDKNALKSKCMRAFLLLTCIFLMDSVIVSYSSCCQYD